MKSKITSFIMMLISILIIVSFVILGIIIYNEYIDSGVVGNVEDFVSNATISSGEKIENIDYNTTETYKYFYNQLEDYSKNIYDVIEKNRENMKMGTYEVNLGTQFSYLLSKDEGEDLLGKYYQSAIEAYTYDNPDVFYLDFSKLYLNIETTKKGQNISYRVFLNSGNMDNYLTDEFSSKEKIDSAINGIERIKAYFVQNKMTDLYDNIKLVHDYIVKSIEYDQSTSEANIYDLYGALISKKSVCEGYSKAFKYLMDALNIPSTIVIGQVTNSEGNAENHAWNYVQLQEKWYAIDCTWDDPIIIGNGILSNLSKYKYFLKGENEFKGSHITNGQFTDNGKVFTFPTLSVSNY